MKKVYCRDCKFNKSGMGIEYDWCKPYLWKLKRKITYVNDYYDREHMIKTTTPELILQWMYILNKKNDCKYFKCKWWKFRIRHYLKKEDK